MIYHTPPSLQYTRSSYSSTHFGDDGAEESDVVSDATLVPADHPQVVNERDTRGTINSQHHEEAHEADSCENMRARSRLPGRRFAELQAIYNYGAATRADVSVAQCVTC